MAKPVIARDNTMEVAAKEGQEFLKEAWGEEKLERINNLIKNGDGVETTGSNGDEAKKPKVVKHQTMVETAKEADALLADAKLDEDAKTRGQQKTIDDITKEPSPKKPKIAKESTMAVTAKEGKELVGDAELGDTRSNSKEKKKKPTTPRSSTLAKTAEEGHALLKELGMTNIDMNKRQTRSSGGRAAASAPAPAKGKGKKK